CAEYTSLAIPILYGGSVKPDNFAEIVSLDNVAGGLVGGASLQAASFVSLVKIAEQYAC
ncbi:MAG: triose-phosphate isomerase, partial [Bdellovibrionales bacterium]|nr:triose-phosphate isomerase [Bdellovibrionales bacterium]